MVLKWVKLVQLFVGIEPQKARHEVTKLNLTILLPSPWYIDINLSIESIFLTLYDLGAVRVAQKIQVMGSLLVDTLSTVGSWIGKSS